MVLQELHLLNYKNFEDVSFRFDAGVNAIVGKNGIGKTNVLDAIYHLSYGKSYFNPLALQNIKHDTDFFVIDGKYEVDNKNEQLICSLKRGQKKVLKRNGKAYEKFSEHLGFVPAVLISPADRDLITEGSENRRKFVDTILASTDPLYLQAVIQYQRILAQRNALLKFFAKNLTFDNETLLIYDAQLDKEAKVIFERRSAFIEPFNKLFQEFYAAISGQAETAEIGYKSDLIQVSFPLLLQESLPKDRIMQYTTVGVHRDDFDFKLNNHNIKKFGSQGQQKSFLIALKLAQFTLLHEKIGRKPLFLFDDIFDKLDEYRVQYIIDLVAKSSFGQIFVTDTHEDRTLKVLTAAGISHKIFKL